MLQQAQKELDKLKAASVPPQERADNAHKKIARLEKKLDKDLKVVHAMEHKLSNLRGQLEPTLAELGKYDVECKSAIAELHLSVAQPADHPQPAG
eukprot:2373022-Pyramimonas_sp.AAC.1